MLKLARTPSPNFFSRGIFQFLLLLRSGGAGDLNKCAGVKIRSLQTSVWMGTAEAGTVTRCEAVYMVKRSSTDDNVDSRI